MDNFRKYIDKRFATYPKSRALDEFKEELLVTLDERYLEYTSAGQTDEQAYQLSIESLGDCSEAVNLIESDVDKNTKALRTKMAAAGSKLYWLVVVTAYLVISFATKKWSLTWIIYPVAVVVYLCAVSAVVLPQGRSLGKSNKTRITAALAFSIVTLAAYFLLSFFTRAWSITWVTILVGLSMTMIFDAAMIRKSNKKLFAVYVHTIVLFVATVVCQLVSHFELISWRYSWLTYLFAAIGIFIYNFISIYAKYKSETSFKK